MANIINLIPVAFGQYFLPQSLQRVPEPDLVMVGNGSVNDFDEIMETNISISLCGMIEFIGRLGFDRNAKVAIDLACGPGHFTTMLAKYFDFDRVIGIDLSEGMLDKARANAEKQGLSHRVSFEVGDATTLTQFADESAGLVTCTNSAHHLPDLEAFASMLREMDRIITPAGTCAVMDLTRMKSEWVVEWYVREMGKEYQQRGLHHLYEDFRNSLFAAWTPEEMQSICPRTQPRQWSHFALNPLPINQFLFSTPINPKQEWGDYTWETGHPPISSNYHRDYQHFRGALLKSYKQRSPVN